MHPRPEIARPVVRRSRTHLFNRIPLRRQCGSHACAAAASGALQARLARVATCAAVVCALSGNSAAVSVRNVTAFALKTVTQHTVFLDRQAPPIG